MPNRLETALAGTGYAFQHWGWSHAPSGDYGVWSEYHSEDFNANNMHAERGTRYYVHLFTRDDSAAPRRKVEQAFIDLRCFWRLEYVQFERDSGYIHFEWRVGIHGNIDEDGEDSAES